MYYLREIHISALEKEVQGVVLTSANFCGAINAHGPFPLTTTAELPQE